MKKTSDNDLAAINIVKLVINLSVSYWYIP